MNSGEETPAASAQPDLSAILGDVVDALADPGLLHPDHARILAEQLRRVMAGATRLDGSAAADDPCPPPEGGTRG